MAGNHDAFAVPPEFINLAKEWCKSQSENMLALIWKAYDLILINNTFVDSDDLERSITEQIERFIHDSMDQFEPFYVQHGVNERETKQAAPAQPPQYDIAFILRQDTRIMWPVEAKVLETSGSVADYVGDLKNEFLTCRYAPFSPEGEPHRVFRRHFILSERGKDVYDEAVFFRSQGTRHPDGFRASGGVRLPMVRYLFHC